MYGRQSIPKAEQLDARPTDSFVSGNYSRAASILQDIRSCLYHIPL
jgi:hypothetical protein